MTTETSTPIDYDTHVDLVVDHAQTLKQLKLVEDERNSLRIDLEQVRELLCEEAGDVAGLQLALMNRNDTVSDLRHQLGTRDSTIRELEEQVAELREQVASRTIAIEERDRVVSEQRTIREGTYRRERDHYLKRAQKAEAELETLKMQHAKDHASMVGYREANGEMDRKMRQDEERIRHLERVIDGLRAEVTHSTTEAPDAVA